MKITYIITRTDQYGGAQIHVRDLSQWISTHGHHASVIAGTKGVLCNDFQGNDVDFRLADSMTRSINPWKDIKAFFQIRAHLKDLKPDLVSCHSSKAGWLGRAAAWSLNIPSIFTAHGWAFTDGVIAPKRFLYRELERISALFCKKIITVSYFDKQLAISNKIKDESSIAVVHNGMSLRPLPKRKDKNEIVQLCMVARFSAQKDHKTLLNALGQLESQKNWHLNLIGDGDNFYADKIARENGIFDRITFHGQRDDVPDYLESQDIFLLISNWEGFPRSILEAMRAGLPVITSDTAGSPEAVIHGKTGFIVPSKDADILANYIKTLIGNHSKCQEMGQAGRTRYEDEFTFDRMAEETLKVYENVLEIAPSKQPASMASASVKSAPKVSQHS